MKISWKDLFIPLSLALLVTWTMQYFFPTRKPQLQEQQQQGERVAVPTEQSIKPLNREVDFVDTRREQEERIEVIDTPHVRLEFSTYAGSLRSAIYKRNVDGKKIDLQTITAPNDVEKEKSFFLVALNQKTPFYYTLENRTDTDRETQLSYRAKTDEATIEKKFTVFKDTYKVDLEISIQPHTAHVQPRLMFLAPSLVGESKSDQIAGVIEESNQSLVKYSLSRYVRNLTDDYWNKPAIFGTESRYFLNVVVNDPQHFVQRGYFSVEGQQLKTILEGPELSKEMAWHLSFYLGPKEEAPMAAVDARLETTLDYGWLAFIAKPILRFMKWLNEYVNNFGFAIVLFTILMRLLIWPVTWYSMRTGEKMKEVSKKLAYLKQKHKDDQQAYQREQIELYRKHGMGMGIVGGMVPLIAQVMIFFALNRVLSSSIELYKAPFLWIPDLSARDPFYILPVLGVVTMVLMSFQLDSKQRVPMIIVAVVFGAISTGLAAGVLLLMVVGPAVAMAQTYTQKMLRI